MIQFDDTRCSGFVTDAKLARKIIDTFRDAAWVRDHLITWPYEEDRVYYGEDGKERYREMCVTFVAKQRGLGARWYSAYTEMPSAVRSYLYQHPGHKLWQLDLSKFKLHFIYNEAKSRAIPIEDDVSELIETGTTSTIEEWRGALGKRTTKGIKHIINCIISKPGSVNTKLPQTLQHVQELAKDLYKAMKNDQEYCNQHKWTSKATTQGSFLQYASYETEDRVMQRLCSWVEKTLPETRRPEDVDTVGSWHTIAGQVHDAFYLTLPSGLDLQEKLKDAEQAISLDGSEIWELHASIETDGDPAEKEQLFKKILDDMCPATSQTILNFDDGWRPLRNTCGFDVKKTLQVIFKTKNVVFCGTRVTKKHRPDANMHQDSSMNLWSVGGRDGLYYITSDGFEVREFCQGQTLDRFERYTPDGLKLISRKPHVYGELRPEDTRIDQTVVSKAEWCDYDIPLLKEYVARQEPCSMIVRSNCGMGKSFCMRSIIQKTVSMGFTHLVILPRTLLAASSTIRPGEIEGVVPYCYLDAKDDRGKDVIPDGTNVIFTTYESLFKTITVEKLTTIQWSFVWFDESETCASSLTACLSTSDALNRTALSAHMKNAKWTMCLDAYAGERSFLIATFERQHQKVVYYKNTTVKRPKLFKEYQQRSHMEHKITNTLTKDPNSKAWYSSTSKNQLGRFRRQLTDADVDPNSVRLWTADSDDRVDFQHDIEPFLKDKRCVLASPAVDCGISVTQTEFHNYQFIGVNKIDPTSLAQARHRARKNIQDESGMDVQHWCMTRKRPRGKASGFLPRHIQNWIHESVNSVNSTLKRQHLSLLSKKKCEWNGTRYVFMHESDFWSDMLCHNLAATERGVMSPAQTYYEYGKAAGGVFRDGYEDVANTEDIDTFKEISDTIRKDTAEELKEQFKAEFIGEDALDVRDEQDLFVALERKEELEQSREQASSLQKKTTLREKCLDISLNFPSVTSFLKDNTKVEAKKIVVELSKPEVSYQILAREAKYDTKTIAATIEKMTNKTSQSDAKVQHANKQSSYIAKRSLFPSLLDALKNALVLGFGQNVSTVDDFECSIIKSSKPLQLDEQLTESVWKSMVNGRVNIGRMTEDRTLIQAIQHIIETNRPNFFDNHFIPTHKRSNAAFTEVVTVNGKKQVQVNPDLMVARGLNPWCKRLIGYRICKSRKRKKHGQSIDAPYILEEILDQERLFEGSKHQYKWQSLLENRHLPDGGKLTWRVWGQIRTEQRWVPKSQGKRAKINV